MKLEMFRGDSALWNLICFKADGSRLNVSTGKLYFTAKSSFRQSDDDAIFQKTSDESEGITLTDGENGEITVELSNSDTSSLYAPSTLKWDLQYVTTGDKVYTLLTGELLVKGDVTSSAYSS